MRVYGKNQITCGVPFHTHAFHLSGGRDFLNNPSTSFVHEVHKLKGAYELESVYQLWLARQPRQQLLGTPKKHLYTSPQLSTNPYTNDSHNFCQSSAMDTWAAMLPDTLGRNTLRTLANYARGRASVLQQFHDPRVSDLSELVQHSALHKKGRFQTGLISSLATRGNT